MRRFVWIAILAAAALQAQQGGQVTLPDGPGKAVFEKACTGCHGLENVVRVRMTKERWGTVVDDMVSRGATATDAEIDQIIAYLAANFGPPKPKQLAKESPKP